MCEHSTLVDAAIMLMSLGAIFGNLLGTYLADRVGRRPVLTGSVLLLGIVGLATAFSPVYAVFAVFMFIRGVLVSVSMTNLILW